MCNGGVRRVKVCGVRVCDVMMCGVRVCDVMKCDVRVCVVRVCDMWMMEHPMRTNHRIGSEAVTQGMMTLANNHAHTHTHNSCIWHALHKEP